MIYIQAKKQPFWVVDKQQGPFVTEFSVWMERAVMNRYRPAPFAKLVRYRHLYWPTHRSDQFKTSLYKWRLEGSVNIEGMPLDWDKFSDEAYEHVRALPYVKLWEPDAGPY